MRYREQTISLCMIVKNEALSLRKCLESASKVVDEIIIVDTGSVDGTKKIAAEFTKKIFDFQWKDDFSMARNYSLSKATKDWILVLDADEELFCGEELKKIILQNEKAFSIPIETYSKKGARAKFADNYRASLFKNNYNFSYKGIVHERLSAENIAKRINEKQIKIIHHKKDDDALKKMEYYHQLGQRALKEGDTNCNIFINELLFFAYKEDFEKFNAMLNEKFYVEKRMLKSLRLLCDILRIKGRHAEVKNVLNYLRKNN